MEEIFLIANKNQYLTTSTTLFQVGLFLNANNPFALKWNSDVANQLCVVSNYTGPLYAERHQDRLPQLDYTICKGPDVLQVKRKPLVFRAEGCHQSFALLTCKRGQRGSRYNLTSNATFSPLTSVSFVHHASSDALRVTKSIRDCILCQLLGRSKMCDFRRLQIKRDCFPGLGTTPRYTDMCRCV